jgi:hypothetical protein
MLGIACGAPAALADDPAAWPWPKPDAPRAPAAETPAQPAAPEPQAGMSTAEEKPLSLLDFRLAYDGYFQGGGTSFAPFASWNPRYRINDTTYAAVNLGLTQIGGQAYQPLWVLEYQAVGGYVLTPRIGVELGLGAETWFNPTTTYLLVSGTGYYKFTPFWAFDRAFATYGAYFVAGHYTSEIELGVGFGF